MAFKIITDSATDLPKEIIDRYQLHVIPTPVTINGTDYFDGKTILPKDFYRIQAEGADIKTYHINQFMFRENFEPYAKAGDEVLYLCFSTGIAGTFNAANLAKEELLEAYKVWREKDEEYRKNMYELVQGQIEVTQRVAVVRQGAEAPEAAFAVPGRDYKKIILPVLLLFSAAAAVFCGVSKKRKQR